MKNQKAIDYVKHKIDIFNCYTDKMQLSVNNRLTLSVKQNGQVTFAYTFETWTEIRLYLNGFCKCFELTKD